MFAANEMGECGARSRSSFLLKRTILTALYFSLLFCTRDGLCDADTIVFPEPTLRRSPKTFHNKPYVSHRHAVTQTSPKPNEIPLDVIRKLNSITDAKQLFEEFLEDDPKDTISASFFGNLGNSRVDLGVETRFGASDSIERKTTLTPKPAACQPELRTVGLRDTNDPTLFYFPTCTRVDRCGGCCASDLLSCQPVTVEYLNFTVYVVHYKGGGKMGYRDKKIITVEQHTKCKCDCTIKPTDCTLLQEYDKDQCRCVCTNKDEESKCMQQNEKKLWNPSICTCQCREVKECSTGFLFDNSVCECVQASRRPAYGDLDRTRYKIGFADSSK